MITDDAFEELPEHEPAWAALDRVTAYRKQLLAAGYWPVPVNGKRINLSDWQNIRATSAIIETWAVTRADHLNTGVLCRDTPFIDIDVTVEEVAEEIEALLESEIENSAVRIGLPPKRAIPFRTDAPFKKIATQFKAPNGQVHKVEILGDGQQIVVNGIHPDTQQALSLARWRAGAEAEARRPAADDRRNRGRIRRRCSRDHAQPRLGGNRNQKNERCRHCGRQYRAPRRHPSANAPMRRPRSTAVLRNWPTPPAGDRNNILYKKSFPLGTMVARGWITRTEVEAALFDAATACGLGHRRWRGQTRRTIESGLDDGASAPHPDLPDQDALQVTAVADRGAAAAAESGRALMRCSKNGWATSTTLDAARCRACRRRCRAPAG